MSLTAGLPPQLPELEHKQTYHHRHNKDSGELDVFEAARYFSGAFEIPNPTLTHPKIMRSGRISLDNIPIIRSSIPTQTHHHHVMENKSTKDEKKWKQPNSPGGKLASFLNSLFNQTYSKKKKSKSSFTESMKGQEVETKRKRRSSISHFGSTNTASYNSSSSYSDSKSSIFSSSSSGFRTPPSYVITTPTKESYTEFSNLSKKSTYCHAKSSSSSSSTFQKEINDHTIHNDGKLEPFGTTNGFSAEKIKNFGNGNLEDKMNYQTERKTEYRKFIKDDDDADSDSSSDLFELPNHDLCSFSSGLPVYETTHMNGINLRAPVTSHVTL